MQQMMEFMKATIMKKRANARKLCSATTHLTEACPSLYSDEEVNAFGHTNGGQGQNQRPKFDPNSQTYNFGWKYHENFRYGGNNYQNAPEGQGQQPPKGPSLTDMVHNLAKENQKITNEFDKLKQGVNGAM